MRCFLAATVCLVFVHEQANAQGALFGGVETPAGAYTSTTTVTANLSSTNGTIPTNFVRLSVEPQDVYQDSIYLGSNTQLQSLFAKLGSSGVVRVGGSSQDTATPPTLTQGIINDFAAFMNGVGSGWTVDWGLDLYNNSPSVAVTAAGYVLNAFASSRVSFAVGNEPDSYVTASSFGTKFNSYYSALTTAYPSIQFEGPEVTTPANVQGYVGAATDCGPTCLTGVNFHYYPFSNPPGNNDTPAWGALIYSITGYVSLLSTNLSYAPGKNVLNETGLVAGGGLQGFTDRMYATLWYLQLAQTLAPLGFAGIAWHNVLTVNSSWGHIGYYNAMQETIGSWYPTPVYYGLYLMSLIQGQTMVAVTATGLDVYSKAIATQNSTGNASILVSNGNINKNINIIPAQSQPWLRGNVLIIQGRGCYEPNPTLNGVAFGAGGTWNGSPIAIVNGQSVTIPPCGAALIQITS